MKKKRLSKQQIGRIQKNQQARTSKATDRSDDDMLVDNDILGPERNGLVITHFGQQLDIEALDGEDQGQLYRCFQRSNLESLVTGDRVTWQQGNPLGVVVAAEARKTLLQRPNKYNELKPIAANINRIVIVIAPHPEPFYNLIDRYLVAARVSNIEAVILLNKTDLLDDANLSQFEEMLQLYQQLGYHTARISCKARQGVDALHHLLTDHTSVFVGQSGVGKSALVNALLPQANTLEGSLSEATAKGRHTTTSARLYHLPQGGDLIDSPGIREFGMWHMETEDILQGFVEFSAYLGQCKFRDCRHDNEAQCRLLQAVQAGEIDQRRLNSFQLICNSMEQDKY